MSTKKPKILKLKKLIEQLQDYHEKYGNIPVLLNLATIDSTIEEDCSLSHGIKFKLDKVYSGEQMWDEDTLSKAVIIQCTDDVPGAPYEF